MRVVLSNAFGTAPVQIGGASVALRDRDASIRRATSKTLLFAGAPTASILAGATLVSDPVDLALAPLSDLAIDLFVPGDLGVSPSPVTTHNGASQTNYVSEPGNHVGRGLADGRVAAGRVVSRRPRRGDGTGQHARRWSTFGDSITDGARSTPDTNNRWPDVLARRLAARKGTGVAVLNAGISGNRVLGDGAGISALARFDKDVLMQTGVTHVVVMEGINDIGLARNNPSPSAADLIAGHKQLIERAHARGLKIYGGHADAVRGRGLLHARRRSEAAGAQRVDPHERRLRRRHRLRQGDARPGGADEVPAGLRLGRSPAPGDAGYTAMGDAVDLALFK